MGMKLFETMNSTFKFRYLFPINPYLEIRTQGPRNDKSKRNRT